MNLFASNNSIIFPFVLSFAIFVQDLWFLGIPLDMASAIQQNSYDIHVRQTAKLGR